VKPGLVRTKMTEGLKLPGALTVGPQAVGNAVLRATEKCGDVIYVAKIWRAVMIVIKLIPEAIFKRMSL
jgi:decaprenylphospho-beta-D-erythro-pentofuranosid-2-ulose 2-reductase